MAPILIDTNVLIYVFDQNDSTRQDQAIRVVQQLEISGNGRLSVQCLAEFCSVTTRRLRPFLVPAEAARQVERWAHAFPVFDLTALIILEAARGVRDHGLAYYDAQLWATAHLNQVPIIFSEDFNSGSVLDGVRFVNPFAPDFDLKAWS